MIALAYGIPTDKEGIQLRLGIERGFFRDEGIDLTLRVAFGGPEIATAYSSGALKIGELGSPPATTALSKGARFRIVASAIRAYVLQYLVVAPTIDDWAALRGTTAAALSIGSCSYWFMRAVLAGHGLHPDRDVRVVGLGRDYPRVVELFEAGDLQAAVLSEPNVSIGEDRGAFPGPKGAHRRGVLPHHAVERDGRQHRCHRPRAGPRRGRPARLHAELP